MTTPGTGIGPDGYVLLRAYLPLADGLWFSVSCGRCGNLRPLSIGAAVALLPSRHATVGSLNQRLRCSRCGNRQVSVSVCPDTRNPESQRRDGPLPETRAGLDDEGWSPA